MKKLLVLFTAVSIFTGCQTLANVDTSLRPLARPDNLFNIRATVYDVDYSRQWNFREDYLVIENPEYYRQLVQRHAQADSADVYNLDPSCDSWLRGEGMHLWHNTRNADDHGRSKNNHCTNNLVKAVYKDFISGENSNVKLFFEEYIPLWIENQAFTLEGYSYEGYQLDAIQHYVRSNIFLTYYTYAPHYGYNTPELDTKMLQYWETFEQHDAQSLPNGRYLDKCLGPRHDLDYSEVYPVRIKMMSFGACGNEAAIYAHNLLITGLYYKSNDHINEALWVVQNITNAAFKDGATRDAVRGGNAASYLMDVSWGIDRVAYEMEYNFGYDVYSMQGNRGATAGGVVAYGVNTWMNPQYNSTYNWIDPSRGHGASVEQESRGEMVDVAARIQGLVGDLYWNGGDNEMISKLRDWKSTQLFFDVLRPTAMREAREKN